MFSASHAREPANHNSNKLLFSSRTRVGQGIRYEFYRVRGVQPVQARDMIEQHHRDQVTRSTHGRKTIFCDQRLSNEAYTTIAQGHI